MNQQFSVTEKEYISRINLVLDYIEKNISNTFTLDELAKIALFSKFHFNRIFKAITGETLFQFINRIRLEKAASILSQQAEISISDVCTQLGFADLSTFSRNFKKKFGHSPSAHSNKKSNLNQIARKDNQTRTSTKMYFSYRTNSIKWRTNMKLNQSVEVKDISKMTVAYVRYTGPYQGNENLFETLWNKLFSWAGPRGLVGQPNQKSLIIYHDDPNITEDNKLRTSVCVSIPSNTKVDGEIGKMEMEGGKYVVARFNVDASEFQQAWEWVYGDWFPESGYQPDDKLCFEMYPEEPKNGKFVVDICVPVKPL